MALQSKTEIYINGIEITAFNSLSLQQSIDEHHVMELVCRMDVLENLTQELGAFSKNLLGETIAIQTTALNPLSGYSFLEFKGIVTHVRMVKSQESNYGDSVIIKAHSPTYIIDDGPHYASYNDMSLYDILDRTFLDYDKSKLNLLINPNNTSALHYSVQHNESAYHYASRLAAQYGEWFYYNGTKLIFGKPETQELHLTYGFDLKEYHIDLIPQSHNYKYYANDYLLNTINEKDSNEISPISSGFNGFVSKKASTIYSKQTKVWHNHYNDPKSKQRLDDSITLQKKATEIRQVLLSGISDNPGVKLGNIVIIEGSSYRVVKITHSTGDNGNYENHFEAVTAASDAYPNTNINKFPKSETQTAIIMENSDPEGLGRVRVQFPWQRESGTMTPWIRIVTPHGGGDKGFHFIPEIKEEVLIGFEGGNAEHPYMMGSLYNGSGKASSYMNPNNDVKAIRTRSGNEFLLNDKDGSIKITDAKGSTFIMDGKGNIHISASNKIKMVAQDIELIARHNLSLTAGNIASVSARPGDGGGEGQIIISAENDLNLESLQTGAALSSKENFDIKSKAIEIKATDSLNLDGGKMADFMATLIKINS